MVCQQKEIRNSVVIHEGHACVHEQKAHAQLSSISVEALLPFCGHLDHGIARSCQVSIQIG